MLILIAVFSLEKRFEWSKYQNHSYSDSPHHPVKNPPSKISDPPPLGGFPPSFNGIWKTLGTDF